MKKTLSLILLLAMTGSGIFAQTSPHWLRKGAISPDGNTIAFSYHGDIWTVNSHGGAAVRVTSNAEFDSDPIWTRDGKGIVFSSYREQTKDIWCIPAAGGAAVRLTTYQGAETPLAVSARGDVYFSSSIQDDPAYGDFPGTPQLYRTSLSGGAPVLVSSIPMSALSVSGEGLMLYEDYKGYEDPLRKHHTSSVTRDIWKFNPTGGNYAKLSTFKGENRNPVFAPDGRTFYFLCEADGCINVWKGSVEGGKETQVSFLRTHPVRNLSISDDGILCFSWNGDLYTMKDGGSPEMVQITLSADSNERETIRQSAASGITDFAVSPNGKEIAVISRGDVYVANVEASSVRRITDTPEQERGLSFNEDGRVLYYAAERDGEWAVWKSSLADKADKYFSLSCNFKEERVTAKGQTCFQPDVSPDGKWVAYLRDRADIVIKDTEKGNEKVLLQGVNYSYADGDQSFFWSPDSRHILCNYYAVGGWNNTDIAMIDVEDGKITNLTRSGYSDSSFQWALKGKAMAWTSDRAGYRSHGSWGTEEDIFLMFFDAGAYNEFTRAKNEDDIVKLLKEDDKKAEKEARKEQKDSVKTARTHTMDPIRLNLEGIEDRTVRLTSHSGHLGSYYLTEDGSKLYYTTVLEKGRDLCCLNVKDKSIKVVRKGLNGYFFPDRSGKYLFIAEKGGVTRMEIATEKTKRIDFSGADWDYRPAAERAYIFEHCWKQVNEKFYDASIHGLDWKAMHDNYVQFLPYIDNNFDFQDLLSEMLGELNGSHTGARYRRPAGSNAPNAGHIGVLYDTAYDGPGLKIAEMLPGGILGCQNEEIKAGDVITAVNGKAIVAGTPWYEALAYTVGRRTQLSVRHGGKTVEISVTPSANDSEALYKRWVRRKEQTVQELSGGRIGYVHVKSMDSESFREVFSKSLGKYRGCEALIVDTRHNGGGWLTDDLITFLTGKAYIEFRPRGQYVGTEPYWRWNKPSCVLVCEDNYSDASGFPYAYQQLGVGKLIGAPVPGTMTAVWWETQVDRTLVFGIPQVTCWSLTEDKPLENNQIEPDIPVYNRPEEILSGKDAQLERAVAEMLKTIGE